ncbi:MAG: tRNA (guanosine(37)-N1)-methyltransferase TrmD [Desulfovibrionales bacterium]|nr:tRNA (guanosine(37)-N1)-methyltransferase TrmD [Desulfovibrionales bacterium]
MIFDILTIFPQLPSSVLAEGILGKAVKEGKVTVRVINLRDYTTDKHQVTDDRPYGGGEGMVMKPEPIYRAIQAIKTKDAGTRVVLLSPQGRLYTQAVAREMSAHSHLFIICGRYEGIDERLFHFVDDEVSIGDYVLSGGELAALVLIESITRLLPGVLGSPDSAARDSFMDGLLKYPQFTRPQVWQEMEVPSVLLSGDHEKIALWRRKEALKQTLLKRPDMLKTADLSARDRRLLEDIERERKLKAG